MAEKRITERDLILPTLYFLEKEPSGMTTAQLIPRLVDLLKPAGKDAEILSGRNDTYFTQKARNLMGSHKTLINLGYVEPVNIGRQNFFTITNAGKSFLHSNLEVLEYLVSGDFNYDDIQSSLSSIMNAEDNKQQNIYVYDENIIIEEGFKRAKNALVYERSQKLRDAAMDYYTEHGHIKCAICSFDFYTQYGERGRGYIEIHHQKPIFQYEEQDMTKSITNALQNVVPVCSNCHRMIHREKNAPMPVENLKQIVQVIRAKQASDNS